MIPSYYYGTQLVLDGTNVKELAYDPSLDQAVFTTEFWTFIESDYASATSAYPWVLCKTWHEWTDGNYGVTIHNDQVRATMNTGGGSENQRIIWGPVITDFSRWYHFAITCDGTSFEFYVNGVLAGTEQLTGTFTPSTQSTFLGRRGGAAGDGFHMKGEFCTRGAGQLVVVMI